jgi:hypothetical protein
MPVAVDHVHVAIGLHPQSLTAADRRHRAGSIRQDPEKSLLLCNADKSA